MRDFLDVNMKVLHETLSLIIGSRISNFTRTRTKTRTKTRCINKKKLVWGEFKLKHLKKGLSNGNSLC